MKFDRVAVCFIEAITVPVSFYWFTNINAIRENSMSNEVIANAY